MVEIGVTRITHCQRLSVLVDKCAVHAFLIRGIGFLSFTDTERNIAELYKLALQLRERSVVELVKILECYAIEFICRIGFPETHKFEIRIGQTVAFRIGEPVVERHETELRLSVVSLSGCSYLLQTSVVADIETGQIHHHLLAQTIFIVKAALIDGESQRGCLVLQYERFVYVARCVARHYAAMYYVMVAVLFRPDFLGLVLECLFKLEYCHVGLDRCLGHFECRGIHIRLTSAHARKGRQAHRQTCIFYLFHLDFSFI